MFDFRNSFDNDESGFFTSKQCISASHLAVHQKECAKRFQRKGASCQTDEACRDLSNSIVHGCYGPQVSRFDICNPYDIE